MFAVSMAASAHDWSTFTGHRVTSGAVERAVGVAERAQRAWVDRDARPEPLARDAHASDWVAWLFARAPARSGVDGPSARKLAQAAGYPAEGAGSAADRWRRDLRQVARLYDARQLPAGSGDRDPDTARGAYRQSLRLLPASALSKVAPVADRIARLVAGAKTL